MVVIAIAIWAYFYFREPENKVSFSFMTDNDLGDILPAIENSYKNAETQKGLGIYLDVPLTTIIKNKSMREITLNNIAGLLSYEGEPILQTKSGSRAFQEVKVNAKGEKPVTDTFQVLINGKTVKYIKEHLKGNKPRLNYDLSAMVLGDVYSFKDSAIINQNVPS